MASLSKPPPFVNLQIHCPYLRTPLTVSLTFCLTTSFDSRLCALKTGPDGRSRIQNPEGFRSGLLRKPVVVSPEKELGRISEEEEVSMGKRCYEDGEEEEEDEWADWEDKILEVTVPLVGFVRMILHSGEYGSGDRLSPEHEKTIIERLLPFHPEFEKKIGCGIDYIMVDHHPDFESSRCLFIVQKDGKLVDFSYWKCMKGLIRKNYPLYAESFIFRHFRPNRRRL